MTIYVPKDEEPKTAAARVLKAMGFRKVDKTPPNLGIGFIGAVLIFIPVVILVPSDLNILKKKASQNDVQEPQRWIPLFPSQKPTGGTGF